ncbi:MAG: guanylate kinase [Betaproteobacteria bacterium]|jgi:guanylate kinase|nr:guanylate kinase [Betaproteobacteria bacterium]
MPGTLITVTAPSGAGKTTLVRELLQRDSNLRLSVSYTTRAPREGEENGREYHFVETGRFLEMRDAGGFVEWAEVHGNSYGTSRAWLAEQLEEGHDTLLEIDWQGARQVREAFPESVSVFVLPPSLGELENRLRRRGTDSEETIALRLQAALGEMRHVQEFAYVIINDRFPVAADELAAIVRVARLRCANQYKRYPQYFSFLTQD